MLDFPDVSIISTGLLLHYYQMTMISMVSTGLLPSYYQITMMSTASTVSTVSIRISRVC
jgi:hypothetical protein